MGLKKLTVPSKTVAVSASVVAIAVGAAIAAKPIKNHISEYKAESNRVSTISDGKQDVDISASVESKLVECTKGVVKVATDRMPNVVVESIDADISIEDDLDNLNVTFSMSESHDSYIVELSTTKDFTDCTQISSTTNEVTFENIDLGYNYYIRVLTYDNAVQTGESNIERYAAYSVYNVTNDTVLYDLTTLEPSENTSLSGYYSGYYDADYEDYVMILSNDGLYAIDKTSVEQESGNLTIQPTGVISQFNEGTVRETACSVTCVAMILKYEYGLDIGKEDVYADAYSLGLIDQKNTGIYNFDIPVLLNAEFEKYGISATADENALGSNESYENVKEYIESKLDEGHLVLNPVISYPETIGNAKIQKYLTESTNYRHSTLVVGYSDEYFYVADPYYVETPAQDNYYYGLRKVSKETLINSFLSTYKYDPEGSKIRHLVCAE